MSQVSATAVRYGWPTPERALEPRAADPTRRLDLLLSADGQSLLNELGQTAVPAAAELAVARRLRRHYPAELVAAVLALLELRQRGRLKFGRAEHMYFTRAGLEQASSERLARYHAARWQAFGARADVCCGIGGDLLALAEGASVLAVDIDPIHLRMAELNAAVYGVAANVRCAQADARHMELDGAAGVFIDPARRAGSRRLRGGSSEPPLEWCIGLAAQVAAVGIKTAPGLPLDLAPAAWEAEFVADGRELKQAVLWSPRLATAERRATVLPGPHTLVGSPAARLELAPPGAYLVDPNPAVTRAGLVEELGHALEAWKIDSQVAFLSADHPPRTPFGRTLRIEASIGWSLKRLRQVLRELDVGSADIRKRGSAVDVDDIRRRLKLAGQRPATVVLTRVLDRPWAFVCSDVEQ